MSQMSYLRTFYHFLTTRRKTQLPVKYGYKKCSIKWVLCTSIHFQSSPLCPPVSSLALLNLPQDDLVVTVKYPKGKHLGQTFVMSCVCPHKCLFSSSSSLQMLLSCFMLSLPLFSTRLSRWRSCHHGARSHSGRSDPQQSRASGCCLNGPAALLPQCGSLGPSPTPDFSADCHTDLRHHSGHDSPPRSEGRRERQGKVAVEKWGLKRGEKERERRVGNTNTDKILHLNFTFYLKIHDLLKNHRYMNTFAPNKATLLPQ